MTRREQFSILEESVNNTKILYNNVHEKLREVEQYSNEETVIAFEDALIKVWELILEREQELEDFKQQALQAYLNEDDDR